MHAELEETRSVTSVGSRDVTNKMAAVVLLLYVLCTRDVSDCHLIQFYSIPSVVAVS